jgi:superfamily II DNA or RNA helicase
MKLDLPDWRKWLTQHARQAAADASEYQLHLAALEWRLSSSLDINRVEDFVSLPSPSVEPFAHQVDDAILFFRRLVPRGLIADDVGLGKTITAGLVARELLDRGRIESLLVVCPKSLVEQWQEELDSKFSIKASVGIGENFSQLDRHAFWITSYHTARSRIDAIRARHFDLLILDEAHALRNLHGGRQPPQVAKAFEQLMRQDSVRYCMMLTATPIQNRLWDIFSLLEILRAPQPNPLGSADTFPTRYIADAGARVLRRGMQEEFRRKVAEVTVRTRRADTRLVFPEREVKTERLAPLPEEKEYIDAALDIILTFPKLVQITHARTLMSSPWAAAAAFEREAAKPNVNEHLRNRLLALSRRGREIASSAKIQRVLKLARASVQGGTVGRFIVFTQRTETLVHLKEALAGAGFEQQIAIMQGGQPEANRRAIRDFMSEPAVRPILLSTDTGAVGLNLQAGNIVINYDLPWNPMLLEQRIGRVQRLGQKARNVIVYNLVLKGTIEDQVVVRLMEKLQLFTQAIGEMEELLQLCGYNDESRSFDQLIMDLIQKAAEQKDFEEDLRRMEESRAAAEEKIREMRQATDQALASLRPKDSRIRLEGLERLTPRIPLPDVVKSCLRREGADIREEDGRLFVKAPTGYTEFIFDRQTSASATTSDVRAVIPGTRAFDHVTKRIREHVTHHILDATGVGLDSVEQAVQRVLTPHGAVLDSVHLLAREPRSALRVAVRVAAEVQNDRYEAILEIDDADEEDGVGQLIGSSDEVTTPEGHVLPRSDAGELRPLGERLAGLDAVIQDRAREHSSVRRFSEFYGERYSEDLERLVDHARSLGHHASGRPAEDLIEDLARRDPSIRAALTSLQLRFVPVLRVEPIGLSGVQYEQVEVEARIRNREQREVALVRIRAIPLTGALRSTIPGLDTVADGAEAWACPGGHLVAASRFRRCSHQGCTKGACDECVGTISGVGSLTACIDCNSTVCGTHRARCAGCGEGLCTAHARRLSGRDAVACSRCSVALGDGRRLLEAELETSAVSGRRAPRTEMARSEFSQRPAFPDELVECEESGRRILPDELERCEITGKRVAVDLVERSAVSGRRGLRSQMRASSWSGRPCLPGEERICDETGAVLLPDEVEECGVTRRTVRKDLLEEDAGTGTPTLRRLLTRSDVSGQWTAPERLHRSPLSGRLGMSQETALCDVCGKRVMNDELLLCPETGRRGCPEHFETCTASGQQVLPGGLGACDVTGRHLRRSLLRTCPETGKRAAQDLFQVCQLTGDSVLPEGLALSSVSGKRVRRSLLGHCAVTGELALPDELASCSVTGQLVRPDLLVTCPDTGARFLPNHGSTCDESGAVLHPSALGQCTLTGRQVRRSLLAQDDLTGDAVLARLLQECAVTGNRTLEDNLAASSVTGTRALATAMARCEVTGRAALPGELGTCAVTGQLVHPDLLATCPETTVRLLRTVAERCDVTGDLVAPGSLAICTATGRRVRRSLIGTDEVTGDTVLSDLLRVCERTGRRTRAENLVTSAVSGRQILAAIARVCEETGASALPDELERCEISGKVVLPGLLDRCEGSGRRVLRRLLRACEITGKRALPEFLSSCPRSGKTVLSSLMATSALSGERGLPDLLVACEATGRQVFADELVTSEMSGKRVARDRVFNCPGCDRRADLEERTRCAVCQQFLCRDDSRGDMCTLCVGVLTGTSGRALTSPELHLLSEHRPWLRRGWMVESPGLIHLFLRSRRLAWRRQARVVVCRRRAGATIDEVLLLPVEDRGVDGAAIDRAEAALKDRGQLRSST